MNTRPPIVEEAAVQRRLWARALADVIEAQIAYADLVGHGDPDDTAHAAAWLRLWRAQERERRLGSELD